MPNTNSDFTIKRKDIMRKIHDRELEAILLGAAPRDPVSGEVAVYGLNQSERRVK